MARTSIKIEGLPQLRAALEKKAAEIDAATAEIIAKETDAIGDDAAQAAPVKTGELRGSIHRDIGQTEGTVRATARYATFVEHGTYKDPAQPFMEPAATKARRRIPETAAAILRKALGV